MQQAPSAWRKKRRDLNACIRTTTRPERPTRAWRRSIPCTPVAAQGVRNCTCWLPAFSWRKTTASSTPRQTLPQRRRPHHARWRPRRRPSLWHASMRGPRLPQLMPATRAPRRWQRHRAPAAQTLHARALGTGLRTCGPATAPRHRVVVRLAAAPPPTPKQCDQSKRTSTSEATSCATKKRRTALLANRNLTALNRRRGNCDTKRRHRTQVRTRAGQEPNPDA